MSQTLKIAASVAVLAWGLLAGVAPAAADEHDRGHSEYRPAPHPAYDGHGMVLDSRYNHGRYYPPMGTVRPGLPDGYHAYYHGGSRYYFSGGVWYAPRGPGFVVIAPPHGLVITVLPPYYSTVWFGGIPFYYANSVYYSWQPAQNGYAVVDPPPNADEPTPPPPSGPPPVDLVIYPKNGQGKEQQAADQYECHNWAKTQSNFDPTEPSGGVLGNADLARNTYNRAMTACLQGRGYQVN